MRLGGAWGWSWGWLKSRQRPEGVSLRLKQGWCVSHQSGCIHMSQELVICSICVCSTSTSSSSSNNNNNVEHTPHNVDVAWWVSGDKTGRGAKFAEACNFFFYFSDKNNRKSTKGKRKRECAIKTENEAAAREDDEDDEMRLCVIAWQSRCCSGGSGRFSCNNPKVTWLLEQLLRWNLLQLQLAVISILFDLFYIIAHSVHQ